MTSVRAFSFASLLLGAGGGAVVLAALAQAPGTRLTYRVRIVERVTGDPGSPRGPVIRVLGSGTVSGSIETRLRLRLRTDTADVEALVQVAPAASAGGGGGGDSIGLGADFFTRRRVGTSRRGLPLWEQDSYRRAVRMAWSDTARIAPFGRGRGGAETGLWIEVSLARDFLGGEARPAEELQVEDSLHDFRVEAVVRPRRARVILNLVRGDTVSGPRGIDLVPEGPARTIQLLLRGRGTPLELRLTRPEEPWHERDRVLALGDDVVCLRVTAPPVSGQHVGTVCGHLTNVARRLPLPTGDTLLATFAWPGSR